MIKYPLNVTIDTNIFESNQFNFNPDSTLSLLVKNVQTGKIKLVLSDVVIKEVENHISQRVDDICAKTKRLKKDCLKLLPEQYLINVGFKPYIKKLEKEQIKQKAKDIYYNFLSECKVEELKAKNVNIEGILDDYFNARPPFEKSEQKKSEFPDAFIAEEIKYRFKTDEVVAIVSNDKGFIKACEDKTNHIFFSSLGELYDALNKNEEEYKACVDTIDRNHTIIMQKIEDMIDDNCVVVNGLSYDKDGIPEGYDYNETLLKEYSLSKIKLHSIDDIDGSIITASLWAFGDMTVDCYFDDFDNAAWDSENKEYLYVDTKHILETHNARFGCRIVFNRMNEKLKVLPFKIILGGDSRKSRDEIFDE